MIGAVVFVTVCPIGMRPVTETTVDLDRALAFAVVGACFAVAYPRHWRLALLLLPVGAFGIEALQFLSTTRHPGLADAIVKAVGAACGILAGTAIVSLRRPARRPGVAADPR